MERVFTDPGMKLVSRSAFEITQKVYELNLVVV